MKWSTAMGFAMVGGVVACSGASASPITTGTPVTTGTLSLELTMDRSAAERPLLLVTSGRASYAPRYPNPNAIRDMLVRVTRSGSFRSTCTSGTLERVDCGDIPFFSSVSKTSTGGTLVRVTDVYGEPCGEAEFPPAAANEGATGNDSVGDVGPVGTVGIGSGGDGATKSDDDKDDDEKDCSCSSDSAGGKNPQATCDEAGVLAQRDAFCADVNQYLKDKGIKAIDCATLDAPGYKGEPSPTVGKGSCADIWQPPYRKVTAWLPNCQRARERAIHWHEVVRWQLLTLGACHGSPLVLDLDGNGIRLTSLDGGVHFDLLGGAPVQSAWIQGGDALLALDRNGNGRIDGAAELFGIATGGRSFADGYRALAELDIDDNGRIDRRDPVFAELLVWRDTDHDGVSRPEELMTLEMAGIRSLDLVAERVTGPSSFDAHGNSLPLLSGFERVDGTRGLMADVFLRFRPLGTE